MELTWLVEEAEKEGEMIPKGSFEGVFNVLMNRHLPEHIFYNHLDKEEAVRDFTSRYGGLARKMYDECFSSGKAVFDTERYSCGLFGVAEKAVLGIMEQFSSEFSKGNSKKYLEGELKFVHDYAFVLREIFCDSCPDSASCVEYNDYLRRAGWKKFTPEIVAVAGD